jgi:hypothetical protein
VLSLRKLNRIAFCVYPVESIGSRSVLETLQDLEPMGKITTRRNTCHYSLIAGQKR